MTREIKVYWDQQDPNNESWAYEISEDEKLVDSGSLDADPYDISHAINQAIAISGFDAIEQDFAVEPKVDGGFAIWSEPCQD